MTNASDGRRDRWAETARLFLAAIERPAAERAAWLAEACADDTRLLDEVSSLLANDDPTFLKNAGAFELGRRFGHFEVLGEAGRGGMGVVYRAVDLRLDRAVALKMLPAKGASDADAQERLLDEARLLARCRHPHIAMVYGLVSDGDRTAIALEWVEGEAVGRWWNGGEITSTRTLRFARQLIGALAAAHRVGVIHGDLSPGNVLLERSTERDAGDVKIIDFGLARLRSSDDESPVGGTPSYLSPERMRGAAPSPADDVYAFGRLVIETLGCILNADDLAGRMRTVALDCVAEEGDRRPTVSQVDAALRLLDDRSASSDSSGLPAFATSFIGRRSSHVQLEQLLESSRWVSIVGPGGIGKTRFAVEFLSDPSRARGAVAFVDLTSVPNHGEIIPAVARALGLSLYSVSDLDERLLDRLRGGRWTLVLDNCEHVVSRVAPVGERWLHACPGLTVLATTRVPIGLSGETVFGLGALELDSSTAAPSEARELFVARARAARPDFVDDRAEVRDAIERIGRRLDGVPLAIELVAARVRTLTPIALARLLDRDLARTAEGTGSRGRSLRSVFEWSVALLAPEERHALARLSLLRGSFELDDAVALIEGDRADPQQSPAWSIVLALAEKSLLLTEHRVPGSRDPEVTYRMLETHRPFAREQLTRGGDEPTALARHLELTLNWVREAAPALLGADPGPWPARVARRADDIREAIDHASTLEDVDTLAELYRLAPTIWLHLGVVREGQATLVRALERSRGHSAPFELHFAIGRLSQAIGESDLAERAFGLASDLAAPDSTDRARCLNALGTSAQRRGALPLARERTEAALALWEQSKVPVEVLGCRNNLGILAVADGRYEEARTIYDDLRRECERGSAHQRCLVIGNGAFARWHIGELAAAYDWAREAHTLAASIGLRTEAMRADINAGRALDLAGRPLEALELLERAREAALTLESPYYEAFATQFILSARHRAGRLDAIDALAEAGIARADRFQLERHSLQMRSRWALALVDSEQHERALTLSQEAIELLDAGHHSEVVVEELLEGHARVVRTAQGEAEARPWFERARTEMERKAALFHQPELRAYYLALPWNQRLAASDSSDAR